MDLRALSPGRDRVSASGGSAAMIVVKKKQTWAVSTYGKVYAGLVFVEVLTLAVFCCLSIWYAESHRDSEQDAASIEYTSIVALVASCAFLYFAVDSILLENAVQLYIALFMHTLLLAYVIWHFLGNGDDLGTLYDHISLAVMVGVSIFQLAYMLLQYPVQTGFGWRLYKKVGGNVAIRPIYRTATIFFSILKLDFIMGVLGVLLAIFYLVDSTLQLVVNVIACVVTLAWMVLGFTFVMSESRKLAALFFLFATLEPAYLLFKLVSMKQSQDADNDADYPVFSWRELILTGSIAVIVRALTIVYGVQAYRNFDLGLLPKIWSPSTGSAHHHHGAGGVAHVATVLPSHQHTQQQDDYLAHPVVIVQTDTPQDRSAIRSYLQPLL